MSLLSLEPFRPEYFDSYLRWRDQEATRRHNPLHPSTKEQLAERLINEGSDFRNPKKFESYRWFVLARGELIGHVGIRNISQMMGYAEIGYGIEESRQGRGYGTEAVRMAAKKVFEEAGLRKLLAYVHDENLASCRLLEKLGFRREGLLREHYILNGSPVNEVLFGLLERELKP
jgi:[ribosomal protein S5]-alanine N-acetyltransferase